jgi:hypothetical protein
MKVVALTAPQQTQAASLKATLASAQAAARTAQAALQAAHQAYQAYLATTAVTTAGQNSIMKEDGTAIVVM